MIVYCIDDGQRRNTTQETKKYTMGMKFESTDFSSMGAGGATVIKDDKWVNKKQGNLAHELKQKSLMQTKNSNGWSGIEQHESTWAKKKKEEGFVNKESSAMKTDDI